MGSLDRLRRFFDTDKTLWRMSYNNAVRGFYYSLGRVRMMDNLANTLEQERLPSLEGLRSILRSMNEEEEALYRRIVIGNNSLSDKELDEAKDFMVSRGVLNIPSVCNSINSLEVSTCALEELPKYLSLGNPIYQEIARSRLRSGV